MTTEKTIRAFCARRRLDYEFQDLKNMGERVVAETHDPGSHAAALKTARRLRGVTVIDWTNNADGGFKGRIFFHDASDMKRITQAEYDAIGSDFKGTWQDYYGDRPEWEGRRTAMLAEYGTRLFIEGVSLEIISGKT